MNKKTEINFGIDSKLEIRDANKKAGFIGQIAGMPLYLISQVYLMLHLLSISLRQHLIMLT